MSNAPWFKFYAADYLSSPFVQSLDPEQELWYLRLIIASAISLPRGCLPLANGKLWRLAKAPSKEYFEQNSGAILAKFDKDEVAGVYRVPKVASQQLLTSSELSRKRSEAGKRGAAKKWQSAIRTDGKLPSETMANIKQNIADSDSDSDSDLEVKPSAANASVTDDGSEPVSICNKLKEIGTGRTREKEGISAQHPAEIIPPPCPPEIVPPHATLLEKLPPKTTKLSPEIIPPRQTVSVDETPDDLHPNQYATRLLEEINFLIVPKNIRAVAGAIEYEAKTMGVMSAYEFVLEGTRYAMLEEAEINTSFFTDRKYRPERRNNGNGRQVSTQAKRTVNTQRNIVNAAITRPNGSPMPEQINPASEQNSRSDQGSTPTSKKTAKPPSHEACRLAALLKSEILRNKPDYRITPAQLRQWELTADRMLRIDRRTSEQIAELIRWVQHDEFWMANVLSMDTLRDKFDQLSMKAELKTRAGDKSAPVKLPPGYVPASERIRQERNAQTRGAQ